jgi:Conserved hypothetical protein 698
METETGGAQPTEVTVASRPVRPLGGLRALVPGVSCAAAVAAFATLLGGAAPVIGAPVFAVLCGMAIAVVRRPSAGLRPGIAFTSKKVLQGSIVLMGLELSLGQVLSTGARSMPVLLGTLAAALVMAWVAGRMLGLRGNVRTLIGVGTAMRPPLTGSSSSSPEPWPSSRSASALLPCVAGMGRTPPEDP